MASARVDVHVDFPLAGPMYNAPAEVRIIQTVFHHDMMVLTYYVQTDWWKNRFRNGSPLVVTWGEVPNKLDSFYGYVLYAVPHVENEAHSLRVICIGASYPLKDVAPRVFPGMSVEQSIALSLHNHHFNLITDRSSRAWPSLTRTAQESLWQFLVRLTKQNGYTLFANKTTVCAYNPVDVMLANLASYPIFNYIYGRGNKFGTLLKFHAVLGDEGAGEETNTAHGVLGVDPRTGEIVGALDSGTAMRRLGRTHTTPRFSKFGVGTPVHNSSEAQDTARGRARTHRWTQRATAQVVGNVRVTQGSGVVLKGVGTEDDGVWFTHKVTHVLTTEEHPQQWRYFMDLDLRRDSRAQQAIPSGHDRPLRQLVSVVDLQTNRKQETPRLVRGRWVAPHASTTQVAV